MRLLALTITLFAVSAAANPAEEAAVAKIRTLLDPDACPPVSTVKTAHEVFPGNRAAAMWPTIVHWRPEADRADSVILVANVNHGTNPFTGVTVFRSAWIRPERVRAVEYVLAPYGGVVDEVAHAQLRFIFDEGGASFVAPPPDTDGSFDDLVLSWEAWRGPGEAYNPKAGLDPSTYELSLRAFSGPQRFLEDTLNGRTWTGYSLGLPGGREGAAELLRVALILGDAVARRALHRMLGSGDDAWLWVSGQRDDAGHAAWQAYGAELDSAALLRGMEGKTSYQTAIRSCATMALHTINVTVARRRGGAFPVPAHDVDSVPRWMRELGEASWMEVMVRAPHALAWVAGNPTALPGKISDALVEAGLILTRNGAPLKMDYSLDTTTPWGTRDQLLIR